MQYRLEVDVVPLLVGFGAILGLAMAVASLEVVVMVAYWYMWWP